jgi:hypothetical protein
MRHPNIQIVQASDAKVIRRVARRPQHPFNIISRPHEITPFLLAPVLPGDTMTNLLMQSRVITDPVANPIIGWWKEYYFFYVPLRSMIMPYGNIDGEEANGGGTFERGHIEGMFVDGSYDLATDYAMGANIVENYTFKGGIDWVGAALASVTGEFFRDEDDVVGPNLDKYPAAYWDRRNWMQSIDPVSGGAHQADDADLPGMDELDAEQHAVLSAADDTKYDEWLILKDAGMTSLTYDDYLREQGVSVPRSQDTDSDGSIIVRPELLRFVRKWAYPTNHIDPTNGTPTSAVSWSVVERADKRRLFKEPGFLFGVTVTRPKVYMGSQRGSVSGLLTNWLRWPSAINADRPYRSLVTVPHSTTDGPLQNQTVDYWIDAKDLFLYGEQFVNHLQTVVANHGVVYPVDFSSVSAFRRPTLFDAKSYFVDSMGTKNTIREDGIVHLNISSRLGRDTTPGGG